ncbi:MAG: glutamate synthase subunit beta [Methylococcales bacterium]|nr:glutamate synthase subunit beta [Methylococcales bacterium]MBT7411289.1 glutamate synthase subunit beta [Methylococcales bacterium]
MGKPTGFLEIERQERTYRPVGDRIEHYNEFVIPLSDEATKAQSARCMDCGIPFCHSGCPVNNIIPDWNDLVFNDKWQQASDKLHSTNNFPEFTGKICPAPCEEACTLNLTDKPVTIKTIECAIVDKAWENNWIQPQIAPHKTDKKIAVIGSGPAGLACAQQLARAGHSVDVYEKNDRIGGLLRYGIPDFKLNKKLIDRRLKQLKAEGVEFITNTHVGIDITAKQLDNKYDAVVLTGGSEKPRDLEVEGRDLQGIYFAMDFLPQQNKRVSGDTIPENISITATDKHVVVIGGGDTGSDCVGTSIRQGAKSVTQFEIMPKPPEKEDKAITWPNWPLKLRKSSSQEEGCQQDWSVITKSLKGNNGQVTSLNIARLEWVKEDNGRMAMNEIKNSHTEIKADLVLLAMGFVHPFHDGIIQELALELDPRGNIQANTSDYRTSSNKFFAAGDIRRGQSLVVWAIREGRQAARSVDSFLMGESDLPE